MRTPRAFVTAALVVMSIAWLSAQDVSGRWTATFTTQVGEQEYTFEFVQKGTVLTGTATGNLLGKSTIVDGKVEGSTITFVENGTYMEMPLRIVYTGKIVSGGESEPKEIFIALAKDDIQAACDILRPVYDEARRGWGDRWLRRRR